MRSRGFTLIELMIVIAILVIVVVVAVPGLLETTQSDNQQRAITALVDYVGAQRAFRDRGVKRVGEPPRPVFARPFGELHRYNDQNVDLMPALFAQAVDAHHPYHGYYFVDDPRQTGNSDTTFGVFAIPAQYKRSGVYVYYVNELGTVRELDPGEQINDPANYFMGPKHPLDPNASGWNSAQ